MSIRSTSPRVRDAGVERRKSRSLSSRCPSGGKTVYAPAHGTLATHADGARELLELLNVHGYFLRECVGQKTRGQSGRSSAERSRVRLRRRAEPSRPQSARGREASFPRQGFGPRRHAPVTPRVSDETSDPKGRLVGLHVRCGVARAKEAEGVGAERPTRTRSLLCEKKLHARPTALTFLTARRSFFVRVMTRRSRSRRVRSRRVIAWGV